MQYQCIGKNWAGIAALVPGRPRTQFRNRWHTALDPSIGRANECTGKWTPVEDSKLKDAVQMHGGKNWAAIASLVPGRTNRQCSSRWHNVLDPSIGRANGRSGNWTAVEDSKLKDAVQTHVARIGVQFPRWFRVERKVSVARNGITA
jgi:hypothetical protein